MSEPISFQHVTSAAPVPFARNFVTSEQFKVLFKQGMGLVEETAVYLDGPGREESKALPREAALSYATESMRLTTRLMQIASWLLVQRAVAEGELTVDQARTEKNRVRISETASPLAPEIFGLLPARLRELVEISVRLQSRIRHLENQINGEVMPAQLSILWPDRSPALQDMFAR